MNVAVDKEGQVKAWRVVKPPDKEIADVIPIEVKNKRPASTRDGSYSVLRANIRERSIAVWIDGEPACDDIPLEAPLGVSHVSVA